MSSTPKKSTITGHADVISVRFRLTVSGLERTPSVGAREGSSHGSVQQR